MTGDGRVDVVLRIIRSLHAGETSAVLDALTGNVTVTGSVVALPPPLCAIEDPATPMFAPARSTRIAEPSAAIE